MSNPKVDSIVGGFLSYLKKENSLNLLPDIVNKLNIVSNDANVTARVTSSNKLSKDQSEKIVKILSSNFGIKNVDFEIDESLLGGIKVGIGDEVVDLSLQNKLKSVGKSI